MKFSFDVSCLAVNRVPVISLDVFKEEIRDLQPAYSMAREPEDRRAEISREEADKLVRTRVVRVAELFEPE
jgi:hypothetical protein